MALSDDVIERACAHIGDDRARELDRDYVLGQLRLKRAGVTHDEIAVAVVEEFDD